MAPPRLLLLLPLLLLLLLLQPPLLSEVKPPSLDLDVSSSLCLKERLEASWHNYEEVKDDVFSKLSPAGQVVISGLFPAPNSQQECPMGYFKDRDSLECKKCSSCGNCPVITKCSSWSDTVCGIVENDPQQEAENILEMMFVFMVLVVFFIYCCTKRDQLYALWVQYFFRFQMHPQGVANEQDNLDHRNSSKMQSGFMDENHILVPGGISDSSLESAVFVVRKLPPQSEALDTPVPVQVTQEQSLQKHFLGKSSQLPTIHHQQLITFNHTPNGDSYPPCPAMASQIDTRSSCWRYLRFLLS